MDENTKQTNPRLRILCFGDSLTAGYHDWGQKYHPYAIRLEERLKQQYPYTDIQITIDGLPGDKVMNGLFNSRLSSTLSQNQIYDWILVLGYVS